jgi:hypothetical protein
MTRPKHQHWVPQLYLRQFATPETKTEEEAQIWIFSKDGADGEEKLTNIRNVCGKRFLYTPLDEKGKRIWLLDEKITEFEATMGSIWPQIACEFIDLSIPAIRKGISLFVSLMHLRNPEYRRSVENHYRKIVEYYKSMPIRSDGCPDIKSIEINGNIYDLDTSDWHEYCSWRKNDHDRFFAQMIETLARNIAELMLRKRWSIVYSDQDVFITSDNPVVLKHQTKDTFGFGVPDTLILFPLSPKRLLVMDDLRSEPANQYYPLMQSNRGVFNHVIWSNCNRFMITGRAIPEVLSEILTAGEQIERYL